MAEKGGGRWGAEHVEPGAAHRMARQGGPGDLGDYLEDDGWLQL